MNKSQFFRIFSVILMVSFSIASQAQEKFVGYFEPSVDLSYQVSSKYSHSFAIKKRTSIYRDSKAEYRIKQLDISHFSEYQLDPKYALGLGLQYRWKNVFDTDEENELRLQQQVVYTPEISKFKTSHRFRTEQRLYASITKHRFRYRLGYTIPIAEENAFIPYVKVNTEFLLEIAKTQKPEFEQRLEVGFGWSLTPKTKFEFGVEYQLADYTQNLNHEVFLMAGLDIKL